MLAKLSGRIKSGRNLLALDCFAEAKQGKAVSAR